MQPIATVLLRHHAPGNTHLDWMLDLPRRGGGLTTFRCADPWSRWTDLGRVLLTELPPHRRAWLTRQGRVSGGRGRAVRVALGSAVAHAVHRHGWHLRLTWPAGPGCGGGGLAGRVVRLHEERWEFVADRPRSCHPAGATGGPQGPVGRSLRTPPPTPAEHGSPGTGAPPAAMLRPGPRPAR